MTSVPLTGWDLAAWRMGQADPALRSTVVGIIEIAGRSDETVLRRRIHSAVAAHRVLRSVVRDGAGGPELVAVPDFDPDSCIDVLHSSASVRTVATAAAHLDFGPNQPLWRVFIIPGDVTYVVACLNHSIADGNGALAMTGFLIDELQGTAEPEPEVHVKDGTDALESLKRAVLPLVQRAVTDPKALVSDANALIRSINNVLDQRSSDSVLHQRGPTFSSAWFCIPKTAVRQATAGLGVSSHDALVALAALAYREYHVRCGFALTSIAVNVPVAMTLADAVSNRMVVARLLLELDNADAHAMMQQSRSALATWRNQPALALVSELADASRLVPAGFLGKAIKKADITVSTLRGIPSAGHIDGLEVSGYWPLVSPVGAAASVTSIGIGTNVVMCITTDDAAITDAGLWNDCVQTVARAMTGTQLQVPAFA